MGCNWVVNAKDIQVHSFTSLATSLLSSVSLPSQVIYHSNYLKVVHNQNNLQTELYSPQINANNSSDRSLHSWLINVLLERPPVLKYAHENKNVLVFPGFPFTSSFGRCSQCLATFPVALLSKTDKSVLELSMHSSGYFGLRAGFATS